MDKINNSSGDKEDYFNKLRNFELKFLLGFHLRRFANLSKELNQLVEQRHSALGHGPKQQQTGLYQPFEVSNAQREF